MILLLMLRKMANLKCKTHFLISLFSRRWGFAILASHSSHIMPYFFSSHCLQCLKSTDDFNGSSFGPTIQLEIGILRASSTYTKPQFINSNIYELELSVEYNKSSSKDTKPTSSVNLLKGRRHKWISASFHEYERKYTYALHASRCDK